MVINVTFVMLHSLVAAHSLQFVDSGLLFVRVMIFIFSIEVA